MTKKENRIAAFIDSLPVDQGIGDCESVLLSTNMTFMGGNGGACINDMAKRCNTSTNEGNCQNYASACGESVNGGVCLNTTEKRQICPNTTC